MIRKLLIVAGCLVIAFVAWSGWCVYSAYQNKQRFDAVMADYAKDQPTHR